MTLYVFSKIQNSFQTKPEDLFKLVLNPGDLIHYLPLQKLFLVLSAKTIDENKLYGFNWLTKILTNENSIVKISLYEAEIQQLALLKKP